MQQGRSLPWVMLACITLGVSGCGGSSADDHATATAQVAVAITVAVGTAQARTQATMSALVRDDARARAAVRPLATDDARTHATEAAVLVQERLYHAEVVDAQATAAEARAQASSVAPPGPAPTSARPAGAHVVKHSPVLMHITGYGLDFNGTLAIANSWLNPKKSFLAPPHFKVVYSYDCSSGGYMVFGLAYFDGEVHQELITNSGTALTGHGTAYMDAPTTERWAFAFLDTDRKPCSWDFTAMKL